LDEREVEQIKKDLEKVDALKEALGMEKEKENDKLKGYIPHEIQLVDPAFCARCGYKGTPMCTHPDGYYQEDPAIYQWVIYDHPKDHPDHFVVRRWSIRAGGQPMPMPAEFILSASLDEARTHIPQGLFKMNTMPADDPVIVEVWI